MNTQRLEYFLALATYLNYSHASQELYISQPALSKQIALLEEELGVKLFYRTKRSVSLTPEGYACIKYAEQVVSACKELSNWAKMANNSQTVTIRLGYYGVMLQDVVFSFMQRLSSLQSNVQVSLCQKNINVLPELLLNGSLDMLLLRDALCPERKEFESRVICQAPYKLIVSRQHPLAGEKKVSLSQLSQEQFAVLTGKNYTYSHNSLIRLCHKYGLSPNITFECPDPQSYIMTVQSGNCVTICHAPGRQLRAYDISLIDLDCDPRDISSNLLAVWNKSHSNPLIQKFCDADIQLYLEP